MTGVISEKVMQYPEILYFSLEVQLPMFRASYDYTTVQEATDILRKSPPEVRLLLLQVHILLRCLLVVPASTATGEIIQCSPSAENFSAQFYDAAAP